MQWKAEAEGAGQRGAGRTPSGRAATEEDMGLTGELEGRHNAPQPASSSRISSTLPELVGLVRPGTQMGDEWI